MAWDHDKSLDRIKDRWERRSELNVSVSRLGRKMDLENITLSQSRRVVGAHLYATVAGSGRLDQLDGTTGAARTVRNLGAWLAEASRIASVFELPLIAAQGARVHLLNYRPIEDEHQLARDALLLAAALRRMTVGALNPQLASTDRLTPRAGLDLGEVVATRGGTAGDSELLFLGPAANRAATLVGEHKVVVSTRLLDLVNGALSLTQEKLADEDAVAVSITAEEHDAALERYGFDWSVQASTDRLTADLKKWPVSRCKVSPATEIVEFDRLGRSNSKLIETAVVIADIDGFSAYVESLESDIERRDAIIALDMIRFELREVLKHDCSGGVRVQYQGDNVVAVVHLPDQDDGKVAERALDIAAGMQASMQYTLPKVVPEAEKLAVTVGVALGYTLATQLGEYGRRNAIVIGPKVTKADRISAALKGTEIGFSPDAYGALPEHLQGFFEWRERPKAWVAPHLPADKLELTKEAHARRADLTRARLHAPDSRGRSRIGAAVGTTPAGATDVRVTKPYADE